MMKNWIMKCSIIPAIAFAVAGCTPPGNQSVSQAPPETPAADTQSVPLTTAQELAKYCRVCVVDKGEKIEEFFPSRLDTKHEGKTYKLCSDDCKKKFDASPKKYALK